MLKSNKYCRFHRDRGHMTEECHHLKNEIEKLIQRGYLKEYVNQGPSRQPQDSTSTQTRNADNLPIIGVIVVISGDPDGRRLNQWINNAQLRKVNTPLTGFNGEMIEPLGEVMLPLSLGSLAKRSTKIVKFLVVKAPSGYNIIFGRSSLNLFRAIVSTLHMKLKFPTSVGMGEAVGDELMAR
ncbi:UNVERIFIED_CONTAM: hypothetical protein Slati_4536900 [Sesamum latifolium]|uniref:Reverse transcriptase domain-containing protein n=1 Tax=Sesamum latifolium TaxID=2727402 RepID=A0AAW2SIG4_9LAMI